MTFTSKYDIGDIVYYFDDSREPVQARIKDAFIKGKMFYYEIEKDCFSHIPEYELFTKDEMIEMLEARIKLIKSFMDNIQK